MKTIERSTNAAVRPSPSISATVYPRGYRARGNDGNMWEIIVDSRGTHRWKKLGSDAGVYQATAPSPAIQPKKVSAIESKVKKQLDAAEILLEDNPRQTREELIKAEKLYNDLERRMDAYILLSEDDEEGSEDYAKAAKMIREFLRKKFNDGGKIAMHQKKKELFEAALESTNRPENQKHLEERLKNL